VVYASSSSALATGSALTFDGTNLGVGVTPSAVQGRIQVNGNANSWFKFYDSTAGFNFGTFYKANGSTALAYLGGGGGSAIAGGTVDDFVVRAEGALIFTAGGGTEALRLTSSSLYTASGINVGIGTSSPSARLDVQATTATLKLASTTGTNAAYLYAQNTGGDFYFGRDNSTGATFGSGSAYSAVLWSAGAYPMAFFTNGTERLRIDSAGNLGLGVTPSAWATFKAFELPNGVYLGSFTGGTNAGYLGVNNYFNGTSFIYKNTDFASRYQQSSGSHQWYTAASGTAGNAITFTQAMTLDASGNLLVGTTTTTNNLRLNEKLAIVHAGSGTYAGMAITGYSGTSSGARPLFEMQRSRGTTDGSLTKVEADDVIGSLIFRGSDGSAFRDVAEISVSIDGATGASDVPGRITFATSADGSSSPTERARITSDGHLFVGDIANATGANARLYVLSTSTTSAATFKTITAAYESGVFWNSATSGNNVFAGFYTETSITPRGSITYNRAGGLTVYNTTSDYRAKDISGPVTNSGALIDSIPVYMGKMKWAEQERPMFIAHEVPSYAHTGEKDAVDADGNPVYQQMDASALIPVMWAEIQSLRQRLSAANL
jgi:hypothetical protein